MVLIYATHRIVTQAQPRLKQPRTLIIQLIASTLPTLNQVPYWLHLDSWHKSVVGWTRLWWTYRASLLLQVSHGDTEQLACIYQSIKVVVGSMEANCQEWMHLRGFSLPAHKTIRYRIDNWGEREQAPHWQDVYARLYVRLCMFVTWYGTTLIVHTVNPNDCYKWNALL